MFISQTQNESSISVELSTCSFECCFELGNTNYVSDQMLAQCQVDGKKKIYLDSSHFPVVNTLNLLSRLLAETETSVDF